MGAVLLAVFFCGISSFTCFLLWDVCGFGFRESWFPTGCWGLFIYLSTKRWIVFFRASFFLGAGLWQDKTKGPKKSIKRERFLIQFIPQSIVWVQTKQNVNLGLYSGRCGVLAVSIRARFI